MTDAHAVVLVVGAGVRGDDVAVLARRLREALQRTPAACTDCDVAALGAPSLETVNALARLQMRARALGAPLRLVNATSRLRELVDLAGLSEVLPAVPEPAQGEPG